MYNVKKNLIMYSVSIFNSFFFRVRFVILFFISTVCTLLFMHSMCEINDDNAIDSNLHTILQT